MFDGERYVTNGITTSIPNSMQNLLWFLIEMMDIESKDHFQIIELSKTLKDGKQAQKIVHKQEQPTYIKEHIIPAKNPITAKIFVIDDDTHSTMLLAEEY